MAGRGKGRGGRGNQGQNNNTEMAEMRRMIGDLSRAVQTLQRRERATARSEVPESSSEPIDIPEGSQEDEREEYKEILFHDACYANMDNVALKDSSVDWETPPIYDEYEEDDGELVLEDLEEISTSETHSFCNEENEEFAFKLFEDHTDAGIHSFEKSGLCTCESICMHPVKPLTFYTDPFLLESHTSYLSNKEAFCLFSSTMFLTVQSFKTEVRKNTPTGILKGETYRMMASYSDRRQNSELEGIICHCKIRGRIFSNKRRMMQCNPAYIIVFNWFLTINHWIPNSTA